MISSGVYRHVRLRGEIGKLLAFTECSDCVRSRESTESARQDRASASFGRTGSRGARSIRGCGNGLSGISPSAGRPSNSIPEDVPTVAPAEQGYEGSMF